MPIEPHILLVDDNPDICELVQVVLQGAGFRVSTADTTRSALQLAASERFDALLLDYWMPDLTGIELCRRIRAFDQSTPILICSGAVTQADREAAVSAGAQGYVTKPFYSGDLIRALRSSLKSKASRSESGLSTLT
jgi:DNA-binding response OmpR family regulator